ncbi:MAG: penicillin-binding protein 2 [Thermomicrobiales bacterium]
MRRLLRVLCMIGALSAIGYGLSAGSEWSDRRWLQALAVAGLLLIIAWWPAGTRYFSTFNRSTMRLATILLVVFALISVQLVRVQIVQSSRTLDRQQIGPGGQVVQNPRNRLEEHPELRGSILDRNGVVLAEQIGDGEDTYRSYPQPAVYGLTGYYSPALYGASGLEASYDAELAGRKDPNPVVDWLDDVLNRDRSGYDLNLTVDLELQQLADDLLGDQDGAVVLMDAGTGASLSLASSPGYDPNRLYTDNESTEEQLAEAGAYWREIIARDDAPLVFRPAEGLYVPGSTFKMLTASAVLNSGMSTTETMYRDEGALEVDGRVIIELNRPDESRVDWTLEESFAYSLNVVFARIGLELGAELLQEYADRFGFGEAPPAGVITVPSRLTSGETELSDSRTLVADTAFGQGELLVTPLQMALLGAAIANDGEIMEPYLVDSMVDADGEVVEQASPSVWKKPINEQTAEAMQELMLASATYGYASGAQIEGLTVGGKTGTAEVGGGAAPHSWFVGYGSDGERTLVTAVIVENGGPGSVAALPIGREMLAAAFAP